MCSSIEPVDIDIVKAYAQDMKALMEEADMAQRKSFIKSLVKGIEVYGEKVIVRNKLTLADDGRGLPETLVLPIETFGGAGGIRTPYLLTASQTFFRVNYGPERQTLI